MGFLVTPKVNLKPNSLIEFKAHFRKNTNDNIAELAVYLANEVGFAENRLAVITPGDSWVRHRVSVAGVRGDYQVIFQVTCGQPFESDVAIDNMRVVTARKSENSGKLQHPPGQIPHSVIH